MINLIINLFKMNWQLILLSLAIIHVSCDTFSATPSSSLTLVSNVPYVLNYTFTSRTIAASSTVTLSLSLNFNLNGGGLSNCMFATTTSIAYTGTTCTNTTNSSGNYILFNSIYPAQLTAQTLLSLKLQMPNPWGAGTQNINIALTSGGATQGQTVTVAYTASTLNSCQWASSSSVNGASSTRTISFIPSVQLIQTSYLQVTLPLWFQTTSNVIGTSLSCSNISNVDFAPTCSFTTIGSNQIFTFSNIFSSNKTVTTAVSLSMGNLYNPWSLYPFTPIVYQLYNTQNGATRLTQSCSGLSQTTTTLNSFTLFNMSGTFTLISGVNTNKVIQFTPRNPIPTNGGQLRISWAGGVTVSYTKQANVIVLSNTSSQLTISNFSSTDILSGSRFLFGWSFVNPPSTRPFTITLTSMYSIGGSTYGVDTTTNTYTCNSGTIITYSLAATTYVINQVATYTITFTTVNALTTGSYIAIVFPAQTSLVLGSTCSSTNSLLSCSVANTSYANISVSGAITSGRSLSITFNSVNNPTQALTTTSFLIYTYYDSGLDSLVDRLISGMTVTSLANQLTSNVFVVPSSLATYTSTSYLFSLQLLDKILSGGYFYISFPSSITVGSIAISNPSFPTSSCVISASGNIVNITSCFSSDYSSLAITFTLTGITNPNSFQPSSSFAITTFGPIGAINYINSGLTVTMNTAATSTAFSITPSVLTADATAVYTISTTFFMPHVTSDYILLTIPSSMLFVGSPSCSASTGIAVITCSSFNTTTLKIILSSIPSTSISFTISSIRNYDISSTSIPFQLYVYNSANFLMEVTAASSIIYSVAAITTYSVSSNNQIVLNQASNITINFSPPFAIDSSFTSSLTSLAITIPAQFSTSVSSSCISSVGTSCSIQNSTSFVVSSAGISLTSGIILQLFNINLPYLNGSSSSFTIQYLYNSLQIAMVSSGVTVSAFCNSPCQKCTTASLCLSCLPSPNTNTIYFSGNNSCLSACPSGYYISTSACSVCISPCSTCSSAILCLTCVNGTTFYASNSSCLSSCPTGYYNSSDNCSLCISPCSTCTTSSSCSSCVANTYLTNSTCVNSTSCPTGTFANTTALTCDSCLSPCANCQVSQSNCTTCISSYAYYNSTCLSTCPSTMYASSSICVSCVSPCYNCSSSTFCLSCISTYLYNGTCYSSSMCPSGTFANTTSLTCDACDISCSTCQIIATNCTACRSPYFNYNGSCVNTCPDGLFVNGTLCQSCVSPCKTCSSTTTCLSCLINYYTNNTCVVASLCPSGTFANSTSLNCDACSDNCSTCSLLSSNCSSCSTPYQYFNFTCSTSCPSGMFASSNICQSCVSPCLTCTSSTTCLSCSSNFYTNYSCVTASLCPSGTFGNTTSLQCDACTSNCTTCFSSSSNCTACTSPYLYYNFQCISSCPNGTFQSSTLCTSCSSPCNQCTSNVLCINCASNYYFYNQTCLSSSLCPSGTYADTTNLNCSACLSPCIACSISSTNCTSCISSLLYYSNQCLSVCPNQTYNSSGICTSCVSPCGNCTAASTCLSCISGFLSGTSCVSSSSCPTGTYAQSINSTCTSCISPCTICYTTTNCTSCSSPYSYSSYSCVSTCPSGTYSSSLVCQNCSSTCLTCSLSSTNCTSCASGLNFYNSSCISGCPAGTYSSSGSCTNCSSTCYQCSSYLVCTSCSGSLYLTSNTCLSTCPSGTYSDQPTNVCQNCSTSCLTCSLSQNNCTSCPSNLLYSSYSCQSVCPTNYFNLSGICTTCPNCMTCTSSTVCYICNSGYYLYNGVCYSSCPPVAPIPNTVTYTCSLCGSSCSSCNADGTFCFTCNAGYLKLTGQCYVTCPSGYTPDKTNTQCSAIKPQSVVYYPFTISLFCISILAIFSKVKYSHSDLIGNMTSFSALSFLFSIIVFTFSTYSSNNSSARLLQTSSLDNNTLTLLLGLGVVVLSILFIVGLFFNIYICRKFEKDAGLLLWKKNSGVNKFMYGLICLLSCFHFAIYRIIYSKMFLRECFSCYIKAHKQLIFVTNLLTFVVILFANAPSIALSILILMKQEGTTQVNILAIDNMIISSFLGILLLLDMGSRDPEDFQVILQDFPYLKRTKKYQDLDSSSGSLVSIFQNDQQKRYKTEVDFKERSKLKEVNIEDSLGNFGAISHLEDIQSTKTITKTLPEFNKLTADINFNPYQLKRQNDDLFFQQKEYTKKFNELKETYHKGENIFEQFIDDDGLTHHNQDLYKEHNVEQIINKKRKEIDPQQYLQKFRSQDYDNISPQEMAVLMEMAQQKGLDPTFMKQTFGKNKYFNRKILQQLIGDHQQVSKQSAQSLLNDSNSQTKLRQVLGTKSTINTDKLIHILNDENHKEIIEAMFNKETGFLSVDAIKDLLADNNKYSKDFITNLLNNKNIDKKKLQTLIDSNKEGQLNTLQTIKDLGGDDLQKKDRMNNMLGKQSLLNPTLLPKINKEMSEESTSNIFDNTSATNNTVIKKVINNKRIKLDKLNPIQQIPQLIDEFAQLLACGDEDIEEDLIEMLQNDNYDGQKLKQLIASSAESQEGMNSLIQFIKENKQAKPQQQTLPKKETPLQSWMDDVNRQESQPSEEEEDDQEQSLPSLNFSINQDNQKEEKKKIVGTSFNQNTPFETNIDNSNLQSKLRGRTRFRKKQPKPIHLPSQEIYLQRLQAPHEVQKNKKFRKAKKKVTKANKFMDQDNEVYDLDF